MYPFVYKSETGGSTMEVQIYGSRGSLPISNRQSVEHGGNTTCLRIISDCIPEGMALVIDAGSGFQPMSIDALAEGTKEFVVLHTHYHHDHTQGLLIAPPIFMDQIPLKLYGPVQDGWGPKRVYETIMQKPLHPTPIQMFMHHLTFHDIEHPGIKVFLVHPTGGVKFMEIEQYRRLNLKGEMMPFMSRDKYPVDECLVITMHYTDHPEHTISYRFEESPTGKTFVFLTDEECRAGLPQSLRNFLNEADLLIQDAQYSEEEYHSGSKAGFGHGTPRYVVETAEACGVKRVGFFHHDPMSTDEKVGKLVAEGEEAKSSELEIFPCADYQTVTL